MPLYNTDKGAGKKMIKKTDIVHNIPIYVDKIKSEKVRYFIKYPYVNVNDIKAVKTYGGKKFDTVFRNYRDDERFDEHWFYCRGKFRGYMLTLDLFIIILEDLHIDKDLINDFKQENEKWLNVLRW